MRSRQIYGYFILIEDIILFILYARVLYAIFKLKLTKAYPSYIVFVNHGIAETFFLFIYTYFWMCMAAYEQIFPMKYTIYIIGYPFSTLMMYVEMNVALLAISRCAFMYDALPNVTYYRIVGFFASRKGAYICVAFSWILLFIMALCNKLFSFEFLLS